MEKFLNWTPAFIAVLTLKSGINDSKVGMLPLHLVTKLMKGVLKNRHPKWKSKTRVTSSDTRVTRSYLQVTSSNPRVARVRRLKVQVEAIKPQVK